MKEFKSNFTSLFLLSISHLVNSSITIHPTPPIWQPTSNALLPNKLTLRGAYGSEDVPVLSLLMNVVEGLADLAHLPSQHRIRGFHVANLPEFTDTDISIQPTAPAVDLEVSIAVDGLYAILYDMTRNKSFKNADFDLCWNYVKVARVLINKRGKSADSTGISASPTDVSPGQTASSLDSTTGVASRAENADFDLCWNYVKVARVLINKRGKSADSTGISASPTDVSPGQTASSLDSTTGVASRAENAGLGWHFEYFESAAKIAPQIFFITVMATLKHIAQWPETDVVEPFLSGPPGFDTRFQLLPRDTPRSEPPFLLYGSLIDVLRQLPAFALEKKKFAELMMIMSFGEDVIGEAVVDIRPLGIRNASMGGRLDNVARV